MDFKYNLEFTDDCKNEIIEIYEYISQNLASTEAAKKLMKKNTDVNSIYLKNLIYICELIQLTIAIIILEELS